MTQEHLKLIFAHAEERGKDERGDPAVHATISIQYAISVLEEYDNRILKFMQEGASRDGVFITPETAKDVWHKTKWHLELSAMINDLKKQL